MKIRILDHNGWREEEMPDLVLSEGFKAFQKAALSGDQRQIDAAILLLRKEEQEKQCK